MSEYISTNKFGTNECPNIFVKEKLIRTNIRIYIRDQYIRIFEYIRHTLICLLLWQQSIKKKNIGMNAQNMNKWVADDVCVCLYGGKTSLVKPKPETFWGRVKMR